MERRRLYEESRKENDNLKGRIRSLEKEASQAREHRRVRGAARGQEHGLEGTGQEAA